MLSQSTAPVVPFRGAAIVSPHQVTQSRGEAVSANAAQVIIHAA
jgi:hypothetical protein